MNHILSLTFSHSFSHNVREGNFQTLMCSHTISNQFPNTLWAQWETITELWQLCHSHHFIEVHWQIVYLVDSIHLLECSSFQWRERKTTDVKTWLPSAVAHLLHLPPQWSLTIYKEMQRFSLIVQYRLKFMYSKHLSKHRLTDTINIYLQAHMAYEGQLCYVHNTKLAFVYMSQCLVKKTKLWTGWQVIPFHQWFPTFLAMWLHFDKFLVTTQHIFLRISFWLRLFYCVFFFPDHMNS